MQMWLLIIAILLVAVMQGALCVVTIMSAAAKNKKSVKLDCRFYFDLKLIVWRATNTGNRNVTILEIGLKCGDKFSSYRSLFSSNDDQSSLPCLLLSSDVASYRKEMEKFSFRPSDSDELRRTNPIVEFYVKDSDGKYYIQNSKVNYKQFFNELMR